MSPSVLAVATQPVGVRDDVEAHEGKSGVGWGSGVGSVCIVLVYTDARTLTYTQRAKLQTRRIGT